MNTNIFNKHHSMLRALIQDQETSPSTIYDGVMFNRKS